MFILTKVSDDVGNDGVIQHKVVTGYTKKASAYRAPVIGDSFYFGSLLTTPVTEIVSKSPLIFKTLNSTYEVREFDEYDAEVERLQAFSDEEFEEKKDIWWTNGEGHSILFDEIGKRWDSVYKDGHNIMSGCLTQIRLPYSKTFGAFINGEYDEELTWEISKDKRIPMTPDSITKASLPVFAEWQRKIKSLQTIKN